MKATLTSLGESHVDAYFILEYIAWTLLALGTGLALQAYLEPGAIPADLYTTIVRQLLDTPL